MQDRLKKVWAKIVELWKKYSNKQKAIIGSIIGIVILMIIILTVLLNKINYTKLYTFEDVTTAKNAVAILDKNGITYKIDNDNVTVYVDSSQRTDAVYALADSDLSGDTGISVDELLNNDMSTTSYDKQLKAALYNQSQLESYISNLEGIDDASISYLPVDTSNTILEEDQDIKCSIFLTTNTNFKSSSAEAIAAAVSNALGNADTSSITIIDQYGELLFSGSDDDNLTTLSSQLDQTKAVTQFYQDAVLRYGLYLNYTYVESEFYLDINYDQVEEYLHEYLPAEGQDQGLYSIYEKVSSTNAGTSGDVPGTDSNDETDYYVSTSDSGGSTYDSEKITYVPSEKTTKTMKTWGVINTATSSGSIVLKSVKVTTQKELEDQGLLAGTTFDAYVAANSAPIQQDVPDDYYVAFSNATGIPQANLTILIYQIPEFTATETTAFNWNLLLTILLFVIIVGLLVFVVFRVSKPVEVVETEPELSVEKLLATTKENQSLDDIEFSDKSEARMMIEKFVDENPEAVALLLRNWLNSDDGG